MLMEAFKQITSRYGGFDNLIAEDVSIIGGDTDGE